MREVDRERPPLPMDHETSDSLREEQRIRLDENADPIAVGTEFAETSHAEGRGQVPRTDTGSTCLV